MLTCLCHLCIPGTSWYSQLDAVVVCMTYHEKDIYRKKSGQLKIMHIYYSIGLVIEKMQHTCRLPSHKKACANDDVAQEEKDPLQIMRVSILKTITELEFHRWVSAIRRSTRITN
jgi:hypothetical protein